MRLRGGRRLMSVSGESGAGHTCAGVIEDCLPHRHRPEFETWFCREAVRKAAREVGGSDGFDLIVVRHGLTGAVKRLSRQALPYELPGMA